MPVVAVVNRKGGSGKSTLATHIAAYWVHAGLKVMLGDVDKQQSIRTWLKQRSPALPEIMGWVVDERSVLRPPNGVTHVVLDTPGGLRGLDLARVVMFADAIVLPVAGSIFDRDSAADCWQELRRLPRIVNGNCKVVCMGMRIDPNTQQEATTRDWAVASEIPFLGSIRENAKYVQWVDTGETLFDQKDGALSPERAQWAPLLQWMASNMNGAMITGMGTGAGVGTGVSSGAPAGAVFAAPTAHPVKPEHRFTQAGRAPPNSLPAASPPRCNTNHFSSQVLADHKNNPAQALGVGTVQGGSANRAAVFGAGSSTGAPAGTVTVSHAAQIQTAQVQAAQLQSAQLQPPLRQGVSVSTAAPMATTPPALGSYGSVVTAEITAHAAVSQAAPDVSAAPTSSAAPGAVAADTQQGAAKTGFKFLSIPDFLRRK